MPASGDRLVWHYEFDKEQFKYNAFNMRCRDKLLAARLDNSPYWFLPWHPYGMTLPCFQRHVRKLAKEYAAKEITVTTLDKTRSDTIILFKKAATAFLDRTATDWEWFFCKQSLADIDNDVFGYQYLYESELFPSINAEPVKIQPKC